jgi:hypothetical protein
MGPKKGQERKKHNKTSLTRHEATEKKDKKTHYIEQGKSKGHMGISFVYLRAKKEKTNQERTNQERKERKKHQQSKKKQKKTK